MFFERFSVKRIVCLAVTMAMMGSAAGCGASSAELQVDPGTTGPGAQTSADYEVPMQIPGVLVDQIGYERLSEKAIVFKGENIPDSFKIYDEATGKPVYTGEILKPVYNEELGEYDSLGYFNDLQQEGSFFAYSDALGESYHFEIKDDIYDEVFELACKKYYINRCGTAMSDSTAGGTPHSACHTGAAHFQEDPGTTVNVEGGWHMDEKAGRDTALGCRIASNLLLANEINPQAFNDNTGIPESGNQIPDILDEVRYEAEWLLKMQDPVTGGIYAAAVTEIPEGGDVFAAPVVVTPVSMDATISFAVAMAMFSYQYQQYDAEFATSCLRAADRAWACFLNNESAMDNTMAFNAAAQLYKAAGSEDYRQVLESYFQREDFQKLFEEDEAVFLGSVTYLTISQAVDVEICKTLMKYLMNRAEDIAARSSGSPYLVTDIPENGDFEKSLLDMRCLTITDHVIYNHEYTTIIENQAHFLCGMNPEALNYISDDTEHTYKDCEMQGLLNDPEKTSLFIFMLSVLRKNG